MLQPNANGERLRNLESCHLWGVFFSFFSWALQFQKLFSTANSQERQADVITKLMHACGWLIKLQGLVAHF
jgi:hypothetical protein